MVKSNNMDVIFYEQYLNDKKILSEGSIYVYVVAVRKFLATDPDIDILESYNQFIIDGSIKKRSYHYYSALKHFIEYKIEDKTLKDQLIESMIKPKMASSIERERKHLSEDKLFEVINYLNAPKHRVIALIQTLTGVRAGDVLRIKQGNIMPEDYEGKPVLKLVILGKGRKRNVVFLHDELAQKIVMNYITSTFGINDYYFLEKGRLKGRAGNTQNLFMLADQNYQRYWLDLGQALNTAGVDRKDFASHDFRRCFARRCWSKYKDIHVLQSVLNHADPKTTLRYLEQSGLGNVDYHKEMQK